MTDYARASVTYRTLSWPSIPCCWAQPDGTCGCGGGHRGRDVGKVPLVSTYLDYFTRPIPAELEQRWQRTWPHANLAILLQPAGLLVVDLDSDHAHREAEHHGLPPTLVASTGKGLHYYYRLPPTAPVARAIHCGNTGKIDLLSHGYVIAPASRHATGRAYRWMSPLADTPLHDAPDWAVEWLRGQHGVRPTSRGATVALPNVLPSVPLDGVPVPTAWRIMIRDGDVTGRYPSNSEARFAVLQRLIVAGLSDADIAAVFFNPDHVIGATARQNGLRWFSGEVRRARSKSSTMVFRA